MRESCDRNRRSRTVLSVSRMRIRQLVRFVAELSYITPGEIEFRVCCLMSGLSASVEF
ncbi:hypothetical protein PCAR4_1210039 [Paraburkholderia caribensis]|nr:hypothetical protein PCAR4_1210039 [Paraburkholderia caribensis]